MSPHAETHPARFVANVLAAAALLLAAAATVNVAVDPFQQYRASKAPRFYAPFQRHENPGIARHYDFDRVLIGSSMTENLAASDVDRRLGGRTFNLSLSAMTACDARRVLEVALRRPQVREVLYNLDFNAFSGAVDRTGFSEPLPAYLYDEAAWNDYPYYLSAATLRKSLEALLGLRVNRFSTDPDRPWYWADGIEFSPRKAVEGLDPANLNRRFRQPMRTLAGMQASFEANVAPLLRSHPGVKFRFLHPPYSVLVWADFRQRGQLEVTLDFKRWLFGRLSGFPNAELHDFQAEETVITDLRRYADIYHHDPATGLWALDALARNSHRVTRDDLETGLARLRRISREADPARIVADARRAPLSD